jgi:hypothetical protein
MIINQRPRCFGGDGHYSEGLANAVMGADVLFIESITRKNINAREFENG